MPARDGGHVFVVKEESIFVKATRARKTRLYTTQTAGTLHTTLLTSQHAVIPAVPWSQHLCTLMRRWRHVLHPLLRFPLGAVVCAFIVSVQRGHDDDGEDLILSPPAFYMSCEALAMTQPTFRNEVNEYWAVDLQVKLILQIPREVHRTGQYRHSLYEMLLED